MQSVRYTVRLLCRLLLGITFTFSGFVKSVDPLGFAYKLQDYFAAFGMPWLAAIAVPLALMASTAELLLGVMLLLDEGRKYAVWGIAGFMFFFTPLTLYLAIAEPVSDCGCFGDAWKISNWATFGKNVALLLAVLLLLFDRWHKEVYLVHGLRWRQYAFWGLLLAATVMPGAYSLAHLPLLDFRPYHVGASLWDNMRIPDDAPQDEYSTVFVYEKDGVQKQFNESNYPWDDSTWHYVSSETSLVRKGYEPPIKHFALHDANGVDIAPGILRDSGQFLLVVWPFLDTYPSGAIERLQRLHSEAKRVGLPMGIATSSTDELYQTIETALPGIAIYRGDERVLKTVVRANPGVVLLYKGIVLGKWTIDDAPDADYFAGNLVAQSITDLKASSEQHWYWAIGITLLAIGLYSSLMRRADAICRKRERSPAIH